MSAEKESRRIALQAVVEVHRGLDIAEREIRGGQFMAARDTLGIVRGLLPMLEQSIQRIDRLEKRP